MSERSVAVVAALMRELYFPTPIYYRDVPDAQELNERLKVHIYAWQQTDQEGIVRSNVKEVGAWHSPTNMNQREEFRQLTDWVVQTADEVYADLGYDPAWGPVCDNMWANISPRHGFNRYHVHPNVLWSGVYYVQSPPDCGRIFFLDPRPQAGVLIPRYDSSQPRQREMWIEVNFAPIEGRIILFPAWLGHEVRPNVTELEGPAGDRISVSFNLIQRRRVTPAANPADSTDATPC
jgi:uncharacterized protein (TIGR02466 family)